MKKRVFTLGLLVFIAGCSEEVTESGLSNANCDSEMTDIRETMGTPEETNTYDSGNYHSYDYWYWCSGVNYSFTWGENVDGCEVSQYTFEPICY